MGLLEQMLAEAGVQPPTVPAVNAPVGEIPLASIGGFPRGTGPSLPVPPTVPPQQAPPQKPFKEVVGDFAGNFLFSLSQALKGSASAPGARGTMLGVASALEAPMLQQQMEAQQAAERQKMAMEMEQLQIERQQMENDATNKSAMEQVAILNAVTARMKEKREAEAAAAEAERKAKEIKTIKVAPDETVIKETGEVIFKGEPAPIKPPDLTPEEEFIRLNLEEARAKGEVGRAQEISIRAKAKKEWSDLSRDPESAAMRNALLQAQVDGIRANREDTLRDDYEKRIADDTARTAAYEYIQSVKNAPVGGAGDIAVIYNFIKMQDPNAVRNEEIELVQKTGSLPDRWKRYLKNIVEGTVLDERSKQRLIQTADAMYSGAVLPRIEKANKEYTDIANRRGLKPENVIRTPKPTDSGIITTPDGKRWKRVGNTMVEQ